MTPEKKHLLELKNSGQFLFHGSGESIAILDPRQAYTYPTSGEKIPDGKPAVFASDNPDVAIFMAIFSDKNLPHFKTWFGEDEKGNPLFKATQETLKTLPENAVGYIHVLNNDQFEKREDGVQWVSYFSVTPVEIIKVRKDDLPEIKIAEF